MKRLYAVCVLLVAGCANPYAQFYSGVQDAPMRPNYEVVQGNLQIYGTDNFDRDAKVLIRRGYTPIGQLSFDAASTGVSAGQLRKQAAKIGAHVVLISSKYAHTVFGAEPFPQTTTPYSSGTAAAPGSGGLVNADGSGTTSNYGSQTVVIPESVARSDFSAVFFAKTKARLGIFAGPVDDETRKRLRTKAGVMVLVVVEGTPAFLADVLPGDILLAVGKDTIKSGEHYRQLLDKYQGQAPVFKFDRDGKPIEKKIEILSDTK
jgi:hypothetical protein